jgi:hypothetical protein
MNIGVGTFAALYLYENGDEGCNFCCWQKCVSGRTDGCHESISNSTLRDHCMKHRCWPSLLPFSERNRIMARHMFRTFLLQICCLHGIQIRRRRLCNRMFLVLPSCSNNILCFYGQGFFSMLRQTRMRMYSPPSRPHGVCRMTAA